MQYDFPIGFIVEGHGEFNCYPSLLNKILGSNGLHAPTVNAGGCGTLVKNVKTHLSDLMLVSNPHSVIITVDLVDILSQELAESCVHLVQSLQDEINEWIDLSEGDPRLGPLPQNIVCVVQVKKFETWLISDIEGLKASGLIIDQATHGVDDVETIEPVKWLKDNLISEQHVKSPKFAKKLTASVSPERMREASMSFDKFYRECHRCYDSYMETLATA